MADSKVTFYLDHIKLKVAEANDKALEAIALQVEAQAKANIVDNNQVDTGFMLNATYVISADSDTYGQAEKTGEGDRKIAPKANLEDGARAAVVAGAEYSIFQEAANSFLFRAAEQVAPQVAGTVEQVGREVIKD